MKQLHQAEQNLKTFLQNQSEQYKQTSNKVSKQYLRQHSLAKNQSTISKSVLAQLNNQIRVLEGIRDSGVRVQEGLNGEIQHYLEQYKAVREQLQAEDKKYEDREQENKDGVSQRKISEENSNLDKESEYQIYEQGSIMNLDQTIAPSTIKTLENSLFSQQKYQIPGQRIKKVKHYTLLIMESLNIILLFLLIIFILFI